MTESLREALESAYEKEEQDTSEPKQEVTAVEEEELAPAETEIPTEVSEEAPQAAESPVSEESPVPEAEAPEAEAPEASPPAETPTGEDADIERAPAGWRGEAKQKWSEVPASVQREVLRRERETSAVLHQTAEARKFVGEFEKTVAPFRTLIEADRSTPMQAVQNLMQTAAGLRMGTSQQKASIVSEIIRQYGVDLETLDSMLAGETPQQAPEQDHMARMLDERLAPVNQFMQTLEQAKAESHQKTQQSVQNEISAFEADPANVYFEDVRDQMAILLDTSAQQGREMTLKQAYDTAVYMSKGVAPSAAPAAAPSTPSESLARKKLAAASVPGTTRAPSTPSAPADLRGALSAAWDAAEQR